MAPEVTERVAACPGWRPFVIKIRYGQCWADAPLVKVWPSEDQKLTRCAEDEADAFGLCKRHRAEILG